MTSDNRSAPALARYTGLTIGFHWLLAILITASFAFGLYMVELPFSPSRLKQYNWHKWAGITILALSALRLLWRLSHRPPPLDPAMPTWQVRASSGTHGLLYVLFFAAPLAGWAYSSAAGFPIVYLGVLPLPDWVPRSAELAPQLKLLHQVLTYSLAGLVLLHVLAGLVLLHVLAAVKHHWIDKDGLLDRMNPFSRRSKALTEGSS